MSFVGPRPERPVFVEQLRKDISYYDERHSVRPGLTGWAQVLYPYAATVEDAYRKLEYDLFYLKNMSILFDCVIILKTIRNCVSTGSPEPHLPPRPVKTVRIVCRIIAQWKKVAMFLK